MSINGCGNIDQHRCLVLYYRYGDFNHGFVFDSDLKSLIFDKEFEEPYFCECSEYFSSYCRFDRIWMKMILQALLILWLNTKDKNWTLGELKKNVKKNAFLMSNSGRGQDKIDKADIDLLINKKYETILDVQYRMWLLNPRKNL